MKTQYETLIEYIINDQEDKARALFHDIVVAKSRDIYESLMDEEIGGNPAEDLEDSVSADEEMPMENEEDEFASDDMGDDEGAMDDMGDDMGDDEGAMDDMGDEFASDDMGDEGTEDKFQNIKDAIADLEAEFAGLMGDDEGGMDDMGDEMGSDMDADMGDEGGMDDMPSEVGDSEEEIAMEGGMPPWLKDKQGSGSGKSGSGKAGSGSGKAPAGSGSGKSGSGKSGSGKSGSGKGPMNEVDMMREYVEKVTGGHGAEKSGEAEGHEIGKAGSSVSVQKGSTVAGKNDMGGTTSNIVSGKGADSSSITGNTPNAKVGGFMKAPQEIDVAKRNVNKVGGNKGAQEFYKTKEKAKDSEGSTTKDSIPVKKDSLGFPGK